MVASRLSATLRQVSTYLAVGVGTAAFELVVFSFIYRFLHFDVAVSNIIAVICATAANFVLNGTVTFKGSSNMLRSIALYIVLFVFNTAFSTVAIAVLSKIGFPAEAIKLATMICIVAWNYVLYRKVVFC